MFQKITRLGISYKDYVTIIMKWFGHVIRSSQLANILQGNYHCSGREAKRQTDEKMGR